MKRTFRHCLLGAMLLLPTTISAQIRVNQVGMYPNQEKTAVIEGVVSAGKVKITDALTGKTAVKAKVLRTSTSPWSKKKRTVIDFSRLTQPGKYVISCGNMPLTNTVKWTIRPMVAVWVW